MTPTERAIRNLGLGETTKTDHRYLALRVFWHGNYRREKSAILCRKHRNAVYRRHREMWDSYEWFPAEACERCKATRASGKKAVETAHALEKVA